MTFASLYKRNKKERLSICIMSILRKKKTVAIPTQLTVLLEAAGLKYGINEALITFKHFDVM